MFYIVVGSITILAFILLIFAIYYNKFQFAIIKINEADENADIYLNKKFDFLKRCSPIIRKELRKKKILEAVEQIPVEDLNHFKLNESLNRAYDDLFKVIDDHEKLLKSENLLGILNELNDNEEDLIASIKFYNDTVVEFNRLISSFPSNLIRLFFRYKKKEFYSQEKHEIFEILKDDEQKTV
ncbi:MAG: LemA family protein [Bacilli bacterium]|nr:LemA family protein [Bacilli bacterium]